MNLALVAIVLAIGAGAVVAVSTRESAAAAVGLAVALVGAALFADPLPSAAILGVRIVGALLAATLIRWAGRGASRQFSPLGWPAEALLAMAAAVAGLGVAIGLAAEASAVTAMALLVAAGCSLLVLGVAPLVHGPLGVRRAVGLVLVTQGVLLVRVGLASQTTELEEIARAILLVTAAATGAALTHAAAASKAAERAGTEDESDDINEPEDFDGNQVEQPGHDDSRRATRGTSPSRRARPAR